ncbi:hypothetical protein Tco_0935371 [Tanacetum coccineum]
MGSSTSRTILFFTIPAKIPAETSVIPPVAPEVKAARVASPAGVLDLITYSSTDSDSSEDPPAPVTSPFLHSSDSFETSRDSAASGSLERPPLHDPYEVTIDRWRSRVALCPSSKTSSPTHDLPHAVRQIVPAPPSVPRRHAILVLPSQAISFGRPYRTEPNRGHIPGSVLHQTILIKMTPSSDFSSYSSSDSLDQADIDADTAVAETTTALEVGIGIEADVGVEVGIGIEREDEVEEEAESGDRGTIDIKVDRNRIGVLERDNMSLRGMLYVEKERVDSLQRHMMYAQEELRQIRITMPATRSRLTPEAINELIAKRVAKALEA